VTATILAAAFGALVAVQQQTDTLIAVQPDVRVEINNVAGDITVRAWDQNQVRVVAEHGSRSHLEIEADGNELSIQAAGAMGVGIIDIELTVPAGASLEIQAPFADISIAGTRGSVSAQAVEGDVSLEGGNGVIELLAVDGDVSVTGASGNVEAQSVDGDVSLADVSGDVQAQTVDGDIILLRIVSTNVEAATVDGDIEWDGDIEDGGSYSFVTHDGDLNIAVQQGANAQIFVASYDADFSTDFPDALRELEETEAGGAAKRHGRRFSFELGTGSARVELESFDGTIDLRRRGSM